MKDISKEQIIDFFKERIAEESNLPKDSIDPEAEFVTFGLDSIKAFSVMGELEIDLDIELNPLHFWEYPTISDYSDFLINKLESDH
ncbi:MAG: acyl carrier protein [Bacteroidota bacterium]